MQYLYRRRPSGSGASSGTALHSTEATTVLSDHSEEVLGVGFLDVSSDVKSAPGSDGLLHSKVLTLNVGGTVFTTLRETLIAKGKPPSFFNALLSGKCGICLDKDGHVFVDRSPTLFAYILQFLRSGQCSFPYTLLSEMRLELAFYSLDIEATALCTRPIYQFVERKADDICTTDAGVDGVFCNDRNEHVAANGWLPIAAKMEAKFVHGPHCHKKDFDFYSVEQCLVFEEPMEVALLKMGYARHGADGCWLVPKETMDSRFTLAWNTPSSHL